MFLMVIWSDNIINWDDQHVSSSSAALIQKITVQTWFGSYLMHYKRQMIKENTFKELLQTVSA